MARSHWFKFASHGILLLFMGILTLVTIVAFLRKSGSTGLDMATIQKIRFDSAPQPPNPSTP